MIILSSLRFWRQHPWQLLLALLGVALGVALVVAVDATARLANQSLTQSLHNLSGQATHQVIGRSRGLDETLYVKLKQQFPRLSISPVVEGYVWQQEQRITLLGLDLVHPNHNTVTQGNRFVGDWTRLLTQPNSVAISAEMAKQLGLQLNDALPVRHHGKSMNVTVVGILHVADPAMRRAMANVMMADIAVAQTLLHQVGRLSRLDLKLSQSTYPDFAAALTPAVQLLETTTRIMHMTGTAEAFQLNLKALSLLALIVGLFLIYNTFTFTVLQRRQLIGIYRAIGVTRQEVFLYLLFESMLMGLIGALIGLVLGYALTHVLIGFVEQSLNDLYFSVAIRQIQLGWASIAKGLILGILAAFIATLLPAFEATTTSPRMATQTIEIEQKLVRYLHWINLIGLVLMGLGGLLLYLPWHHFGVTFTGLFTLILGFACLVPSMVIGILLGMQTLLGRSSAFVLRMALRSVRISLARTSIAIAALCIAIATTTAMGLMIGSFRVAVSDWLHVYLKADIYVSPMGASQRMDSASFSHQAVMQLQQLPGVAAVSYGREVQLESRTGLTTLLAINLPVANFDAFVLLSGEPELAKTAFFAGQGVLVSEPYAYHHQVQVGDNLRLPSIHPLSLPIVGIYRDYGSEQGEILLHRSVYVQHWQDESITSIGVYAKNSANTATVLHQVHQLIEQHNWQPTHIRPTQTIIDASLAIFDRTFAVTQVLRWLAVVVAFIGIMSAVMAIQLERAKEMAVLRAVGLTRGQLGGLVLCESSLIGMVAGLLAIPLGAMIGYLLVTVINQQSFGWSMDFLWDLNGSLQGFLLAITAAFLAGIYPAWQMAQANIASTLRGE